VGVHANREAKIAGQVTADLVPRIAGIVAAHDVPMFLHEQDVRPRGMHRQVVHAVTHFSRWIGKLIPEFKPLLIGRQVSPPSSVRKAPAAEIATYIRFVFFGSIRMVCRHIPPAPAPTGCL